jgi:hypothetical protein
VPDFLQSERRSTDNAIGPAWHILASEPHGLIQATASQCGFAKPGRRQPAAAGLRIYLQNCDRIAPPIRSTPQTRNERGAVMRTKFILVITLGAGLVAGSASAQSVDQRHANQAGRVEAGEASGRLTPGEAARVEHQQSSIESQEARMRARTGGKLTASQRAHLQTRESKASQHIYNAKHNGRGD